MRLGILGGTFDPVHYGHLLMAETCRQQLHLDTVIFLPAGLPPHKQTNQISEGSVRVDMLRLALSGYPEYTVDQRELRRDGPSYTVDTLREFHAEQPSAELFFLMGADSLRELMTWKEPQQITQLATVVACNRPGLPPLTQEQIAAWVAPEPAEQIAAVQIPGTDLSSTDMRRRVQDGRGIRFMTPRAVEAYIAQHGIYQTEASP